MQAKKVAIPSETPQEPTQVPKPPASAKRIAAKARPKKAPEHGIVGTSQTPLTAPAPFQVKDHPTPRQVI